MGRLRAWVLDWVDRAGVQPSDSRIDDPLSVLSRIATTLGGLLLVASSDVVGLLVPDINPRAEMLLRAVTVLAALVAVNHVVTAKDSRQVVSGPRITTVETYRYSGTDRFIARAVVAFGLLLVALNFVPAPPPERDCRLTAEITVNPAAGGAAQPLFLALVVDGREERFPVTPGRPVAMPAPAAHAHPYSVFLLWSDASSSDFGEFSGCPEPASRRSIDGRASIDISGRDVAVGG